MYQFLILQVAVMNILMIKLTLEKIFMKCLRNSLQGNNFLWYISQQYAVEKIAKVVTNLEKLIAGFAYKILLFSPLDGKNKVS